MRIPETASPLDDNMVKRKPVPARRSTGSSVDGGEPLPYPSSPSSPIQGQPYQFPRAASSPKLDQSYVFLPPIPSISEPREDAATPQNSSEEWASVSRPSDEQVKSLEHRSAPFGEDSKSINPPAVPDILKTGPPTGDPTQILDERRASGLIPVDSEITNEQDEWQDTKPAPSNNPFQPGWNAGQSPTSSGQTQTHDDSNIWEELERKPSGPIQPPPVSDLDQLRISETSSPINHWAAEPHPEPMVKRKGTPDLEDEAPLISFDAEDYRSEVQQSPFASGAGGGPPLAKMQRLDGHSSLAIDVMTDESPADLPDIGPSMFDAKDKVPVPQSQSIPPSTVSEAAPAQTPISSTTKLPLLPPPPPIPLDRVSSAQSQSSQTKRQRSETYQIKHVRWTDWRSPELRTTPVLMQNANGPCPLLALVNALTMSTPPNVNTGLNEVLRIREQVSLGLLLDAVFDELMSGRRGEIAQELPDVGDLYAFLVTLHTGMNVNPRLVPERSAQLNLVDGLDTDNSISIRDYRKPGGFEKTKEMTLYSTFAIPLIHGWLPHKAHPAFNALERSAPTYEDAQNILFREEELEGKLQREGLNGEEQRLLEDIASIKYFLDSSATQLTGFGLDTITEALDPGSIAILFRNDHFSTLYKHPRNGQLLHLVTDMGYAGHDEVIWESLVDTTGEGSQFLSGDFRPVGAQVGGSAAVSPAASSSQRNEIFEPADSAGWQTVTRPNRRTSSSAATTTPSRPHVTTSTSKPLPPHPSQQPLNRDSEYNLPSPKNTEQEDADLALAMQLQEEEEDRSRRLAAQRTREDELSHAFISSSNLTSPNPNASASASPNPATAGGGRRRGNTRNRTSSSAADDAPRPAQTIRPLIPPRREPSAAATSPAGAPPVSRARSVEEEALPTYEQAAKAKPYHPPTSANAAPLGGPPRASPSGGGFGGGGTEVGGGASGGGGGGGGARPRGQSAYSQNFAEMAAVQRQQGQGQGQGRRVSGAASSGDGGGRGGGVGDRRRSAGMPVSAGRGENGRDKDRDCVVM